LLGSQVMFGNVFANSQRISDDALAHLINYANNHNIIDLHNAKQVSQLSFAGFVDTATQQLILKVSQKGDLVGFLNMNPISLKTNSANDINASVGQHFVEGRYVWLGAAR